MEFLAAVERGFRRRLGADPGYTGLIIKNPLHPNWRTRWMAPQPYKLADLAGWLSAEDMRPTPAREAEAGLGRNCELFDAVRFVAYDIIVGFRDAGNRRGFVSQLHIAALTVNATFNPPLFAGEVGHVVKSIAKWTWKNYGGSSGRVRPSFSQRQAERGRWSGEARLLPVQERRHGLVA